MKTVLVTGGAGFIGSHVVDALLHKDYRVVVVDNFSTGRQENLPSSPQLVIADADITDYPKLLAAFQRFQPDMVIHAAAQASVRSSLSEPWKDAAVNINGTINLLECCRAYRVKNMVYLSSGGAVYGIPDKLPCTEQTPALPANPYGVSKLTAEEYISMYHRLYGIEYCILRLTNTYGPRQNPSGEAGVVAIFTDAVLQGIPPTIFGDGEQTRDFVYVEDVAEAVMLALERNVASLPQDYQERVFNISFGEAISINKVLEVVNEAAGAAGAAMPAKHSGQVHGEVRHMVLDSSLAKKALGWMPRIAFEEGVRRTVAWARENTGKKKSS